ncbi:hypothetical protein DACRYDRAFT_104474 [Dacryopinax primogenitus]|uniref:Uncharacterized protein n=1 Tax=Dacryopinax primogenitus (strain DJM 731) TaxID=1858805 RepID=M5G783_DACPD|nr:uncharacterized protein DACRYDRAFT_104474 [Dacryopinax primogenitus]EJU04589.1 hypothetical protein DACRYDRAFT_104474 [Dacryopinax primogenitus]
MPIRTPGLARPLGNRSSADSILHFGTQAELDAYMISKMIDQTTKARLTRHKELTLKKLHACWDALLAPIYKLPDEILRMIFIFFCTNPSKDLELRSAVTLSHVVRRWRNVVLSIPKLWTYLSIHARLPGPALMHQMRTLMTRSLAEPVHVVIDIDTLLLDMFHKDLQTVSDAICRRVYPRCERLTLEGRWTDGYRVPAGLLTFQLCPGLRFLSIFQIELPPDRITLLLVALQSCEFLETLVLSCGTWYAPENDGKIYTLRSLRHLTSMGESHLHLIEHLSLPLVEEWILGCTERTTDEFGIQIFMIPDVIESLRLRFPKLHTLIVKTICVTALHIAALLLQLLPLHCVEFSDRWFLLKPPGNYTVIDESSFSITRLDFTRCRGVSTILDDLLFLTVPHVAPCKIQVKEEWIQTPGHERRQKLHDNDVEWITPTAPAPSVPIWFNNA